MARLTSDPVFAALTLEPDTQAHYGIRVNQGFLCLRQAKMADDLALAAGVVPLASPLGTVAAETYRKNRFAEAVAFLEQARQTA